ncbi:aminotransferase class V-fold PLP-dependent enzyme [uncultured Megasphaera sp.]|uniref:aminotransferase class V-fold PLP-dependent enzyme n=1 Tax=uncultured Megasphaera sp. TaxID=165188 RepID=UPI0025E841B3|nr:aminotransferase class V-fold PLP-dependent enzyme [uncultured Megasphaera sp.]
MYYFDNAATTAKKPEAVGKAVFKALTAGDVGNPSRGAHGYSLKAYGIVLAAKEKIKALFHGHDLYDVAFTHNSTTALNMVLKGLIRPGDGVLTTAWEHNAVLRPLYQLEALGAELAVIPAVASTGALVYDQMENLLTPKTKWLVCNHASNVTGNVLDLNRIKAFCRAHHLGLIVDVSQTAGAYDIDLSDGRVTAACFTGHKSLYGPGGTGGIIIRRDVEVLPFITGGDGVHTFEQAQPSSVPTVFEAGTANVAGIAGLSAAVGLVLEKGIPAIMAHQEALARAFIPAVKAIPGIRLYGDFSGPRVGVYSLNIGDAESAVVSDILWETHHMATRPAYHCAPLMHQALGTAVQGTVRFSFSQFTTVDDVLAAAEALDVIARS